MKSLQVHKEVFLRHNFYKIFMMYYQESSETVIQIQDNMSHSIHI